ncbi:hypothetical protein [Arsukibacterium perlucidum]|uniref:hypothetical protein n=1 Tax=Arsukibacterium perlucidum TaxID=368811 RepID=UPI00036A9E04|nr:hypothetical protein [Arsukibacterium perlucidum]
MYNFVLPLKFKKMKMIKTAFIVVLICLICFPARGVPTIRGTLTIDISEGIITGDITLENFELDGNSAYLLNHGLNIKEVRDGSGVRLAYKRLQESPRYESSAYVIPTAGTQSSNYVPSSISFLYTGKFPVYVSSEQAAKDWKGNIAFNDSGLRTDGLQSALFPTFFTYKNDKVHNLVTYDLTIDCPSCSLIYIAGDIERSGPKAKFKTTHPSSPMLVAGSYKSSAYQGTHIIESSQHRDTHFSIGTNWTDVIDSTKSLLSCDIGSEVPFMFLELESLDRRRSWMWASTNAIVSVGNKSTLKPFLSGNNLDNYVDDFSFLVHEYSHLCMPGLSQGGSLSLLVNESIAEYISLISTGEKFGQAALDNKVCELQQSLAENPTTSNIHTLKHAMTSLDQYSQRYIFGPLLLLQVERTYGRDFTLNFINQVIAKSNEGVAIDIALLNSVFKVINKKLSDSKDPNVHLTSIDQLVVTHIDCNSNELMGSDPIVNGIQ